MDKRPIGILDSGIGGLTVVKEIINTLPTENIIYLGDTARIPYGTRGKDVIEKFSLQLVKFLLQENPKALVTACNTVSATCLDIIQEFSPVPVIGVIIPTVEEALQSTKSSDIGVIGTRSTIATKMYEEVIHSLHAECNIITKACPLFVSLAEEGFLDHPATKSIAEEYLADLKKTNIDTLILGCTHYPLLSNVIQEVMGDKVKLIDSAKPTAHALKKLLETNEILNTQEKPTYKFYVTDDPEQSERTVNIFFDHQLPGKLEKVTL